VFHGDVQENRRGTDEPDEFRVTVTERHLTPILTDLLIRLPK